MSEENKVIEEEKIPIKKKKDPEANPIHKAKLSLNLPLNHPLASFATALKRRGIKDCNINELAAQALEQVDSEWWEKKLDDLTPLEYRINVALSDPSMRDKLTSLLADQESYFRK